MSGTTAKKMAPGVARLGVAVSPRVIEGRRNKRAVQQVASLLPEAPARARFSNVDIAAAVMRAASAYQTAERVGKLAKQRGEKAPTGDTIFIRTRSLTPDLVLGLCHRVINQTLHMAREQGILPGQYRTALDSTRIPYWGEAPPECAEWVVGGKEQSGTKYAMEYLSLHALAKEARLVLAYTPLRQFNKTAQIVQFIRRSLAEHQGADTVLLDRGFFNQAVLQELDRNNRTYIIPTVRNPALESAIREAYREGRRFFSTLLGATPIIIVLADNDNYSPEDAARRGAAYEEKPYLAYATNLPVLGASSLGGTWAHYWANRYGREYYTVRPLEQAAWISNRIREEYRLRGAVETDYRSIKNDFMGWTTSNKPAYRQLQFGVGIIMFNMWQVSAALEAKALAAVSARGTGGPLRATDWKQRVLVGLERLGWGVRPRPWDPFADAPPDATVGGPPP